jgi:hypothetical protein
MSTSVQISEQEAKAIIAGGLGDYELRRVAAYCAPLYWAVGDDSGNWRSKNGTVFFLNAGAGVFAVTAWHVIEQWRVARAKGNTGPLRLGGNGTSSVIDLDLDLIAMNREIDIATFRVTEDCVKALGKEILMGNQTEWPPAPPEVGRGVYYGGFPTINTLDPSPGEASFGVVAGLGIAHSVSERDICAQLEREYLMPSSLGEGIPPNNFDFGGISGGLMLTVIEKSGLRLWSLAGVIWEGPNTSNDPNQAIPDLEVIRARRAHFILPGGQLDVQRWNWLTP